MAVTIKAVESDSPAQRAGLCAGMTLVSVDDNEIFDGLDYEFHTTGANLLLKVWDGAEDRTVKIQKAEYQPLGCVFDTYLIDKQHFCKNRCVFCFVDQLPRGMRPSLYFKDDDERLGFLFGNYITLTNLSEREVQRIIAMRFSPVNISVHTANPQLRVKMMGNKNAGKALDIIPRLAGAGIEMNFQLVLCPGWNDDEELEYSLEWLEQFRPQVRSIAAVPVGLTQYRDGLPLLQSYDAEGAGRQLEIMLKAGDAFAKGGSERLVYPSDEWFLLAGRPVPEEDFYDGYPQLENGVGMWRLLHDEFMDALVESGFDQPCARADLAVGVLSAPLMEELAGQLQRCYPDVHLHVHAIQNDFFGPGVTVTGLVTGRDIIAQMKGKLESDRLLLPEAMLRAEGDVLLDDMSPEEVGRALGVTVEILPTGGENLLAAVLNLDEEENDEE